MFDSVEPKKSGLAKAAAVLAIVFLVSLGLCGVNFLALSSGGAMNGAEGFLFVTAYLELFGMAVGAVGLVIVGIIAIVKAVMDRFSTKESESVSIIEKDEEK